MTPDDRELIDKLHRESHATWRFQWNNWLKYRSDREAAQFALSFAIISVTFGVASFFMSDVPFAHNLSLVMFGVTVSSIFHILTVKRMRRFWNDIHGRDIWYSQQ